MREIILNLAKLILGLVVPIASIIYLDELLGTELNDYVILLFSIAFSIVILKKMK